MRQLMNNSLGSETDRGQLSAEEVALSMRRLAGFGLAIFALLTAPVLSRAQGVISTAAGNGTQGFSGDGGPASSAQIRKPVGVAVDRDGNLYIWDYGNNRIRKVNTAGIINTVAGKEITLS